METKNYFSTDAAGNILPSATCYVYVAGTTDLAAGLVNINGAPLSNPFTALPSGLVQFKAPDGEYDLRVTKAGRDFTIRIQCFDGVEFSSSIEGEAGASLINYRINQDGSVKRTQLSKNSESISAYDFGLLGDGSDETEKLVKFLAAMPAAGKSYFQRNKVYGFTGQLKIPDGSNLVTNGSTFRRLVSSSGYGITLGANVKYDELRLSSPGSLSEGGFHFTGDEPKGGRVKFASDSENCGGSSAVNAVLLQKTDGSELLDPEIGKIFTENHARPFRAIKITGGNIGRITGNGYITGGYIVDAKGSKFDGARFNGCSSLAVGGPGQNALLMEATSNGAMQDVEVCNWTAIGAAEHGFRLGGQSPAENVTWRNCVSRLSGSGSAPTGGSGFKVLGPNSIQGYHRNIVLENCTAEDSGQTSSGNNFCALAYAWAEGGSISNFRSVKKTKEFSANRGILISHLKGTTLSNPNVEFTRLPALSWFEEPTDSGLGMYDVSVIGGVLHRAQDFDVVTLDPKACRFENVRMEGTLIRGGRAAVRAESPTTGGSYDDVSLAFTYVDPTVTSGTPALSGPASGEILYDVSGPWYGTSQPAAKDGSIYTDTTSGLVRVRKGGAWQVVGEPLSIGGTWTPSLTSVTNIASSSTNSAQYMRVGQTVNASGFIQVKPSATGSLRIDLDPPVTSAFSGFSQAAGVARTDNGDIAGIVQADASSGRISLILLASTTNNRNLAYQFTYRIQ